MIRMSYAVNWSKVFRLLVRFFLLSFSPKTETCISAHGPVYTQLGPNLGTARQCFCVPVFRLRTLQSPYNANTTCVHHALCFFHTIFFSEYAGQVLRVDGGEGIFLDVVLLSNVLNPVLDHTLRGRVMSTSQLNTAKYELINAGVLRCDLARHLWEDLLQGHDERSFLLSGLDRSIEQRLRFQSLEFRRHFLRYFDDGDAVVVLSF